jgi:hypothetical protein
MDCNTYTKLFLQRNMSKEATTSLLGDLKPNFPNHNLLQTRSWKSTLSLFPMLLMQLLVNKMFNHYDHPRIVQLCEIIDLYMHVFQHYKQLHDIECIVITFMSLSLKL